MLDNEPTGGSGAGDTPASGAAKTSSARNVPPAPVVLFVAPEATTPPSRPAKGFEDDADEAAKPTSRRRSRTGREDAKAGREDESAADGEATGKPARRARSRRGKTADGSSETTRKGDQQAAEAPPSEGAAGEAEAEEKKPARRRRGRGKAAEAESVPAEERAAASEDAEDTAPSATEGESAESDDESAAGRRRRRRGRRGRGRGKGGDEADDSVSEEGAGVADSDDAHAEEVSSVKRRRRRRRKGSGDVEPSGDDGVQTVVRVREARGARDEVQGVAGSTRLEAKRQRRRDGREQRRTRPPILTESEFLARRESVDRVMAIRSAGGRTQIGVLEDGVLVEHYVSQQSSNTMAGNVYLGKVQNVLPSMEAAFVDIGRGRNAVLYAGEVNWDVAGLEGRTRTIEQALRPGDSVLVQVTKDPVGHKGARLTSHITLSGRHLVYVPHGNASGISRKLPDIERKRLRDILKKLVPEGAGVIVRTAAEGASEDDLTRDVERLQAQWATIEEKAKGAKPPTLVYEEPDLVIRVVRDIFNEDFKELMIQGEDAWDLVEPYLAHVSPELVTRIRRHAGPSDVFADTRIDEQILKALDRKVYLPSGGHLVIDRTEAMTVIDVNTGKFTGKGGNLEETVTRNNLEAAEEIVHQLRLRDIGGIIVIDFIDMVLESNRDLVLRRLTECLGRDRTKHQVTEITSLGLVQMTRKRVGQGLLDAFSVTCEHCRGRGVIVNMDVVEAKSQGRSAAAEVKRVAAASGNGDAQAGLAASDEAESAADEREPADQAGAAAGKADSKADGKAKGSKSKAKSRDRSKSRSRSKEKAKADAGESQPNAQAEAEAGAGPDAGSQEGAGPQADGAADAAVDAESSNGRAEAANGTVGNAAGEAQSDERAPV
ncbi:MAG: Rne/Rng family ribonuclease [Micromonosporaceae bacterium]|nr:Rne/Rng family ribonuclease [Micromonosporaceae bacterium]